jgi:hypothetical protein
LAQLAIKICLHFGTFEDQDVLIGVAHCCSPRCGQPVHHPRAASTSSSASSSANAVEPLRHTRTNASTNPTTNATTNDGDHNAPANLRNLRMPRWLQCKLGRYCVLDGNL